MSWRCLLGHDWRIRGMAPASAKFVFEKGEGSPITIVFYQCRKCECVKTETIDGHWSIGPGLTSQHKDVRPCEPSKPS